MHDRGSWDMVKVAAIAAVLGLGFYIGGYYGLVRVEGVWTSVEGYSWSENPSPRLTAVCRPLFRPMNWLDRRLRQDFWHQDDPFAW